MNIIQKIKFLFVRRDTPTENRPDDMTSKKVCTKDSCSCSDDVCENECEEGCDCCEGDKKDCC